ncbi:MAG: glutathione S-transferase family protein [Acetobacteraceae bacterium]
MEELILHHYDFSPFSEKIRLIFGIKGLPWRSVTIPSILPKPDLVALTGGYRHTPVMQIGADMYCDTRLIADELDRRFPDRPLLRPQSSGVALAVEAWAERDLFWPIARYVSGTNAAMVDPLLHADRAALRGKRTPSFDRLRAVARSELGRIEAQLPMVASMLSDGRSFLVSDEIDRADLAVYHGLWFLKAMPIDCSTILEPYPEIGSWMKRVAAVGNGTSEDMTSRAAIDVAGQATPSAVRRSQPMIDDPRPGSVVAIRPDEYRTEEVVGELVLADRNELAIRRVGDQVGEVVVHFPRLGYTMRSSS